MTLHGSLDVTVGDGVDFAFTVTNDGDAPRELQFRNGLAADVAVLEDADEVWRWSDGRMVTQALWTDTLAPGGSAVYEARWDDPTAGRYEAVATLAAEGADVEDRAAFEV
jgi:hypothetical protein